MKNIYISPEIEIEVTSKEDVMLLSDTFVDVGGLWGSEGTGNAE